MNRQVCRSGVYFLLAMLLALSVACGEVSTQPDNEPPAVTPHATATERAGTPSGPRPPAATSRIDELSLWLQGPHLRGANVYQRRVYPKLDGTEFLGSGPVGPPYSQEDFDRLAAMGANYVNISHPGLFTETPPYVLDPDIQANLDHLLSWIGEADMFAVISFRTGPGRAEFSVCCLGDDWLPERYLNDRVWEDREAQDAWVEMWRYTADRYRESPVVVGYDLMVEPNANEVLTGEWLDPGEFYARYGGTLADWNQLHPRITMAIREVDVHTPILIGGTGYSGVDWLPYLEPTSDSRTVYLVHQYAPHLYTHQEADSLECSYPGDCDLNWDGEYDDWLDLDWLDEWLSTVDDFAASHDVPVAVNEFGIVRWAPGAAEFLDDEIDLFEQRGMNHALWAWEPSWEPWTEEVSAFNFRHGPDADHHSDLSSNELSDTIARYWDRNTIRPSSVIAEASAPPAVVTSTGSYTEPPALGEVTFWAYQLQDISEPGAVEALVESHYDLLVLEPTRTDWSSTDKFFDTREMVDRLKRTRASDGLHRKLVIAYIDIGEAEDWRWYWTWSTEWNCRPPIPADWPDYILACDPDGWTGNYPVAYWDEDWRDVIIYGLEQGQDPARDYGSAIEEAINDGFDGIYLDWVEGYEDRAVIAAANSAGVDPATEMIAFIAEMRDYATTRRPGFLIIQQNAAELIDGHPELVGLIDAIAQEAIWYDGDATDDWDDPDGYDWENDSDLTNYYLDYLSRYQDAGLLVFNCEYALAYAAAAYSNASAEGLIPLVTRRSLSRLTTTPPPGY